MNRIKKGNFGIETVTSYKLLMTRMYRNTMLWELCKSSIKMHETSNSCECLYEEVAVEQGWKTNGRQRQTDDFCV